jgi:DNA-binding NarL/FixJ family response regulator
MEVKALREAPRMFASRPSKARSCSRSAKTDAVSTRPDVIIMDLQVAPIDGIESNRQARYDDIEVVALTSLRRGGACARRAPGRGIGYVLKDSDAGR